jgi:PAS domain-containing protein
MEKKDYAIMYQELFENINSGIAVYEAINNGEDFIFIDFNKAAERITDAGGTVAPDFIHNSAIRQRQMRQGMARGIAATGGAVGIHGRSRRGNSYNPPRTAQGSGRNA